MLSGSHRIWAAGWIPKAAVTVEAGGVRWQVVGEIERGLLDGLVGGGEPAFVLAEVFFPGGDSELFDESIAPVSLTV